MPGTVSLNLDKDIRDENPAGGIESDRALRP